MYKIDKRGASNNRSIGNHLLVNFVYEGGKIKLIYNQLLRFFSYAYKLNNKTTKKMSWKCQSVKLGVKDPVSYTGAMETPHHGNVFPWKCLKKGTHNTNYCLLLS